MNTVPQPPTPVPADRSARAPRPVSPSMASALAAALGALAAWGAPATSHAQAQPGSPPPAPAASPDETAYFALEEEIRTLRVVSTASKIEESMREAPVPVTVVTADMIRSSGARTLQDVLVTFVPGMTFVVDHNEPNVAARGIYASSPQKILVLLDGHRLNARAYPAAEPDYSIGLHKVKRIEILRGPGSSLYGNVALMAVVNIITKSGKEVEGVTARIGGGNFGQATLEVLAGEEISEGHEVLMWGSTFYSNGQKIFIPASQDIAAFPRDGYAIAGGIKDPISYDLGAKYRHGALTLLASTRQGHLIEPFTSNGVTGEVYDYDSVRTFETVGPGMAARATHFEARYARPVTRAWEVDANAYYDRYNVTAVYTNSQVAGGNRVVSHDEDAVGGILQARHTYEAASLGSGSVLVGGQFDQMRVLDSVALDGSGGAYTVVQDSSQSKVILPGTETVYSGFVQVKHKVRDSLVLNLGLRYDHKDRRTGGSVSDWSPRLALVYAPSTFFDVKLSYGQSFVDAPYWYRYNSFASYRGASTLVPEHLRSLQLTPTVSVGRFRSALNVFYDDVYDFIFRNNNAAPTEPIYQNAGTLKSVGVENETEYLAEAWRVRANFTYQRAFEVANYTARGPRIYNVPPFVANLILDFNPFVSFYEKSWFNVTVRYTSRQLSPISAVFRDSLGNVIASYQSPDNTVDAYFLVNAGIRLTDLLVRGLNLDATVYNALDQRYEQGGSPRHPYPQQGRSFLALLSYNSSP